MLVVFILHEDKKVWPTYYDVITSIIAFFAHMQPSYSKLYAIPISWQNLTDASAVAANSVPMQPWVSRCNGFADPSWEAANKMAAGGQGRVRD